MEKPLVNIVIVTFNKFDVTEECIRSLFVHNYPNMRILIVDNGSEKRDHEAFAEKYKENKLIEFIKLPKNLGFGGGANVALKRIKSGYIVLLNNDTVVTKDWLNPIIAYMENHPDVGICQPKIKDIVRKNYFEYAGAAGGFMDIYGFPFARGRIFYTLEEDYGQYDHLSDIVWSGVVIVTKKEALDKVGYFDEIFFLYAEEADLCWRMHHAGFRLAFIPNSIIYHHGAKKIIIDKTFFNHRNGLIMLVKNYSTSELFRYLPVRLALDFLAFFYYLVKYPPQFVEMIKAYLSLLSLMPEVIRHRIELNKLRKKWGKPKFKYPLYQKSIIVDYFLRNKKKFSDLNYPIE